MSLPAGHPASSAAPAPSAGTADAVVWTDPARGRRFDAWLAGLAPRHGLQAGSLRAASADASFRRYFRVDGQAPGGAGEAGVGAESFIVMDAPPAHEDVRPFIEVAGRIAAAGLPAPQVLQADVEHGFLLLTDLGSRLLLTELQAATRVADGAVNAHAHASAHVDAEALMRDAVGLLVAWQQRVDANGLPPYDGGLLRRELALFSEWCVAGEFGVRWNDAQQAHWAAACDLLVASALAQPLVAVHRDYMPRNLMVLGAAARNDSADAPSCIGILDFQDAVRGPIGYDVASLLRDAFISWDEEQELDWAVRYWQQARRAGLPVGGDFGEFWRQLEWIGLQRHLKVLGIFCRLKHRDGKPAYSADLPRFFGYAHKVASRYQGLGPLARLIEPLMGETRVDVFC